MQPGNYGRQMATAVDSTKSSSRRKSKINLPPLFLYIEAGNFRRAAERAKKHPKDVRRWASIKIKSSSAADNQESPAITKRLALHHACFKLRTNATSIGNGVNGIVEEDPFIEVCRFILLLIEIYPEACGMRETRHGCLPLHLAAFASCAQPIIKELSNADTDINNTRPSFQNTINSDHSSRQNSFPETAGNTGQKDTAFSTCALLSALPSGTNSNIARATNVRTVPSNTIRKPSAIRSASESTADAMRTTMSAIISEDNLSGLESRCSNIDKNDLYNQQQIAGRQRSHLTVQTDSSANSNQHLGVHYSLQHPKSAQSVSIGSQIFISEKREEYALRVLNSLLDAYPRGIRMESEGKRLALHTACAGRATYRVMSTLITAYPAATRHRNKDGFLPLHLCAHWGISSPNVVVSMLKQYPDATFGRNRWERTPLEEALSMAGENGRPHQAALVRALRKHPSYWTRPEEIIFQHPRYKNNPPGHNIVDIDETIATEDDATNYGNDSDDEDHLFLDFSPYYDTRNGHDSTQNKYNYTRKDGLSPVTNDIQTLIQHKNWDAAAQRLIMTPTDANLMLTVVTRGGFISTIDFTPLHYACERRPPKQFIETLIKLRPSATTKRTMPGGALPLHIACTWHASKEVVDVLLTVDRNACKISDELGNLPLHSSCFSGASSEVVETLLKAYPKAVLARNHQGSLPEDITKRLKHDNRLSVLALLNLSRDEVASNKNMKNQRNASHPVTPLEDDVDLNEKDSNDAGYQTIENIDSGDIEVEYDTESAPYNNELFWI